MNNKKENTGRPNFVRRQYFVDRSFQLHYAFSYLFFMFVMFVIFSVVFYRVGFVPLIEKMGNVYPQMRLYAILKSVYFRLFLAFVGLLAASFVYAVLRSHRIAGPLMRLKRHVAAMNHGDFSGRLKLRDKDDLKMVAEQLNHLSLYMKHLVAGLDKTAESIQDQLHEAETKLKKDKDISDELSGIKEEIERLKGILSNINLPL